ncbi:MAG: recombinase family protein [Bdellovibrionaceae bacterium]|nr:recombinase family protein [Pseudobdellovibrionaceae bacterium]
MGAYIRLSPSDEIREEGSLVSHPQRIRQFVDYRNSQSPGWGKIIDWYTDKDYSGKDMNRPEFKRLCRDIKDGKVNAVIVTELSRLSRSVKDFVQFWDFLKRHKATFYSLKESFDTSTPMGELMVVQAISFAQFERETIVSRIKEGAKARAERGLTNGGRRLLGYDPDPYKKCHLIVNEAEVPYVKMIFEKFPEMGTVENLMRYLNENGYRTKSIVTKDGSPRGGNLWSYTTLHRLLTNPSYIGKREINKDNRHLDPSELSENDRYRLVKSQWPAILSEDLFREAQELLEANAYNARKYVHQYRLTGLIHCHLCGEKLFGKSGKGKGGKYFYYGHMRKFRTTEPGKHQERCPHENIPAVQIEEAVIQRLKVLSRDTALLTEILKANGNQREGRIEQLNSLIQSKEQDRRRLEKQIDGIVVGMAEAGEASRKLLTKKLDESMSLKDSVEAEIRNLKQEKANAALAIVDLTDALKVLREFQKGFDSRPLTEQKEILKDVMKRIVVHPTKLVCEIYGQEGEEEIPFDGNEGLPEEISGGPIFLEHFRTRVRPGNRLVEAPGVEPGSASDP